MLSLSVGFAAGLRHCVHVVHVAGPLGVMTTYAVTGPAFRGGGWALAAATARVATAIGPATTAKPLSILTPHKMCLSVLEARAELPGIARLRRRRRLLLSQQIFVQAL